MQQVLSIHKKKQELKEIKKLNRTFKSFNLR